MALDLPWYIPYCWYMDKGTYRIVMHYPRRPEYTPVLARGITSHELADIFVSALMADDAANHDTDPGYTYTIEEDS